MSLYDATMSEKPLKNSSGRVSQTKEATGIGICLTNRPNAVDFEIFGADLFAAEPLPSVRAAHFDHLGVLL